MKFNVYSDFIMIVGMKAAGKTTVTKHYCKSLRRLIFIDPTWQLDELGYVVHFPERIVPAFQRFSKVIYQPSQQDDVSVTAAFDAVFTLTNFTLGIDEVDTYASPRWYCCESLKAIIRRGRRQGIGLICNTRRPHNIHNDIRSNADYVICFKVHEERDLKYMSKWLGISEQKIKELPFYESFLYDVKKASVTSQSALY